MAKKKPELPDDDLTPEVDDSDDVSPAALPEAVVDPESVHVIVDTPINAVVVPEKDEASRVHYGRTAWEPPSGHIVRDDKTYHIRVGGVRYVHVGDSPDGRWVYRAD